MSYKEKPQIKLYEYQNSNFVLQAIIDDYAECSFENNRFQAGKFSITINHNIPNALLFKRGLFVQFGNNPYNFGEIFDVSDSIGSDGKGSQIRNITGYDIRYIFKRRIIKNLNNNDTWSMTAKGELCMRNLIQDQCGINAEEKRRLPVINTILTSENAIGSEYSVSESFSNLYDVLTTIATQTEIGWRLNFNGETLTLEFYLGEDKHTTVRFDTNYESLSEGKFTDTSSSFANAIFVGGKGTGSERDIYEGENAIEGNSPSGLDRFEAWDNQSEMTTEEDYAAEALSMLCQYGQTLQVSGKGLAKCPYEYGKEYYVGDIITLAFSDKSAVVQILSVTEHWVFGNYNLDFEFGKPQPDLNQQLQLLMRKIQKASSKTNSTESVKWYTIPTDSEMPSSDVTFNTIGFTGTLSQNRTFTFYLDNEKTGAKNYTIYVRNLTGTGKLTLTTGRSGVSNVELSPGNYVGKVYIDEYGNIILESMTATSTIESGNNQPVTSDAVAEALGSITPLDIPVPVSQGGTGQTTAKGAEYNIIGGVEQVTTDFDDNRYIAVQNQTVNALNGTFRWFKVSNLWNYIKGKIQSIALTIGSTASAIAETLYGSLTVKNSSGTTTASISQAGQINCTTLGGRFRYLNIDKDDNAGKPTVRLLLDITSWWNGTTGVGGVGINGFIGSYRISGYTSIGLYAVNSSFSYGRNGVTVVDNGITSTYNLCCKKLLPANGNGISFVIVKDSNDKYYLGLALFGSNQPYNFWGFTTGTLLTTQLACTGSSVSTLPTGYTLVLNNTTKDVQNATSADTATTSTWTKGGTIRPTTANLYPKSTNGSLTHFLATSTMVTEKPVTDGHIIHMSWDNNGGYGAQLFLPNSRTGVPQYRTEAGGTWTAWKNFITADNIADQTVAIANKIRTSAPSSPADGDIWIE